MPILTGRDVHVDAPLTDLSVAFLQRQENYLAAQVFPVVPVAKQSDRYYKYSLGDLLRDEAEIRAPGTESAGSTVSLDNTPTYFCDDYAIHEDVSDQIVANADSPLNPKKDAAENVAQKLVTKSEVLWVSKFFGASLGWTDWAGVTGTPSTNEFKRWDQSGSDPNTDIDNARAKIQSKTGYLPNVVVLSPDVFFLVKNHSAVVDRIKYTQRGIITPEILASLWDVKKVVVGWAVKNTAAEGATAAISNMFSNGVFVCYAADAPGLRKPSAGYTFSWNGYIGSTGGYQGGPAGGTPYIRMKQFRIEQRESDRVEGDMPIDHRMIAGDLGLFMDNVIAA